jgi:hypothetical protein
VPDREAERAFFELWVQDMTPGEKAEVVQERGRIIRSRPMPPATSDEVLGTAYREAQAQALLTVFRRRAGG